MNRGWPPPPCRPPPHPPLPASHPKQHTDIYGDSLGLLFSSPPWTRSPTPTLKHIESCYAAMPPPRHAPPPLKRPRCTHPAPLNRPFCLLPPAAYLWPVVAPVQPPRSLCPSCRGAHRPLHAWLPTPHTDPWIAYPRPQRDASARNKHTGLPWHAPCGAARARAMPFVFAATYVGPPARPPQGPARAAHLARSLPTLVLPRPSDCRLGQLAACPRRGVVRRQPRHCPGIVLHQDECPGGAAQAAQAF
jgi:hypothetical protein